MIQDIGEDVGTIPFVSEEANEVFSLEITRDPNERRFQNIAEALKKNYTINLIVEDSANVIITGNFVEVTINDFLSYVVKAHDLTWFKVGEIYHFRKDQPPTFQLKIDYNPDQDLLSVDAQKVAMDVLARQLTLQTGKNVVVSANVKRSLTGFVKDLPFETALAALLRPQGLALYSQNGFFEILTDEAAVVVALPEAEKDLIPELSYQDGLFSGLLDAETMDEALSRVAGKAHKSIKFLDPVEGSSSKLYLENASFADLLNKLFTGTVYSYKEQEGVYLVGTKTRPELTTSELIPIKHMNAQNILAYLSGSSTLFQTYNLPARPDNLGSLSGNSFGRFGQRDRQISNRPRVATGEQNSVGSGKSIKETLELSKGVAADITLVREHNALMVTATQDVIEEIKERLDIIDKPVPQVLIQALVIDFTTMNMDTIGINITNGDFSYFPELDVTLEGNRDAGGNFRIARLPSNFEVRLQALATQGKARIISKPHIATLSGHEAYIEVGLTQYLRLTSENLVGTETPISQTTQRIEPVEANISLRVIPWVTASGEITTYIEPVFNTFQGQVEDNIPPPISTRRLQSTIRLKNGETIILGGLIEEATRASQQGIPGLSRIPILGHLFKNRTKNYDQTELVIYLTPYVYYGDEGSVQIIRAREGLDYPLDVRKQNDLISKKKKKKKRGRKKKEPPPDEPSLD